MSHFSSLLRKVLGLALIGLPGMALATEGGANGIFLIATDEIRDPNFRETVVLVTQPESGGPLGVIINRPLNRRLVDALPQYESMLKGSREVVHYGGPVARGGLVFLVRAEEAPPRAIRVLRDVHLIADRREIDGVLKKSVRVKALRAYAGYSGWGPGQLQSEIRQGSWHVMPADAQTVFERDAQRIWPELSKRAAFRRTAFALPQGN